MKQIFLKHIFRRDVLQIVVDWLVSNAENILIRATPILSPLPSAFAITRALNHAGWEYALWLGGIIEAMGMGAGALMGYIATHNQQHPGRMIRPWVGQALFGFYVLVAVLIVGGLETMPTLTHWLAGEATAGDLIKSIVPLLFPGLTLIGSVIVALREYMRRADAETKHQQERQEAQNDVEQQHKDAEFALDLEIKRREAEQRLALQQAEHEQRLSIERLKLEAKLSQPTVSKRVSLPADDTKQETVSQDGETRLDAILRHLEDRGDTGASDIARNVNASRATIYRDLDELLRRGKIRKMPDPDKPEQFKWEPIYSTNGHTATEAAQ